MSVTKTNILFVLPSLVAGGAERVMSLIAENIDNTIFNTTLLVIGFEKDKAYQINGIKIVYLNKTRMLNGIPKLFLHILISKPQIVMSCMAHVNNSVALILLFFPKIKLVTREANIKKVKALSHLSKKSNLGNILNKITIKRTNSIVCQSDDMAKELITEFKVSKSKVIVINNPISDEFTFKHGSPKNNIVQYITVGRLHEEKGHLRLLNLLSKLDFPFHYTIIGNGEWYQEIVNHVKKLNLKSKVSFINYTNEVAKYLKQSNVFLQGSFAEGFPNALLESCAVGTPVIAFNAPGGTGEIIEHGINGYIANNQAEYLMFLNKLQENNLDPIIISQSVFKKFSKELIVENYEALFKKIINLK